MFLQVWTNYVLYIYTLKKIRVHICSTETFSFLVPKYFFKLCPHLVLLEHSLTNKSSLKKVPWKIFQSSYTALLEQKCFGKISFLMMFWSEKFLTQCFKVGSHICWLERKGKESDLYQKSKPSVRRLNSSKSHFSKCWEMCKMSQSCSKSLTNTITNILNSGGQ